MQLKLYKDNSQFIIEYIDTSNQKFKIYCNSEEHFLLEIKQYKKIIDQCDLNIEKGIGIIEKVIPILYSEKLI